METANHSMEMEKRQIAISSSSKRDKGTFPKYTPSSESSSSESESCYQEDSNRSTRSESPACKAQLYREEIQHDLRACEP
ncbi:hypothetical protein G5714_003524 [Onychostoma macrolepis]|uniref:Uncharacterized protein n=1 Tax=Onychostoma macrolepis TaxID=369639 RepID=A0A7J6DAH8_9TELE|nr:hypothetical protein G5714_003524 [Onychostoma macrolepis]